MRLRTKLAALAATAGVAVAATAAYAAWTASGEGSGSVQAKSAVDLVVTDIAVTDALFPGGESDLKVNVANPNPYPVTVTAIDGKGAISAAGGIGACDGAANVSYADQSGTWVIAANGNLDITLGDAVSMIGDAADGCQGATFTVPVKASGASSAL